MAVKRPFKPTRRRFRTHKMKNQLKTIALVCLIAIFFTAGCKKNEVDPTVGFSAAVQNVAPQATIDALRKLGMTINEGTAPPNVTGIFIESPTVLFATFTGDTKKKGDKFTDYTYKFYESSTDNSSVKVSFKSSAGGSATGLGSVVAGNGNKFTIFSELTTSSGDVVINIISGEITTSGVKNWQDSYVLKTEVEKTRIFEDGDGLASATNSFRMAFDETKASLAGKGAL